jgi:hypothetical protein
MLEDFDDDLSDLLGDRERFQCMECGEQWFASAPQFQT